MLKRENLFLKLYSKSSMMLLKKPKRVFERFNILGSCVDVVGTLDKTKPIEEFKIHIPFKLVGMHEAFEKNFDWIVLENPFDESSKPKRDEKGSYKTHLDEIPFIVEDFASIDFNASSFENT